MSGEPPEGDQAPDEATTILPTPREQAGHGDLQAMQVAPSMDIEDEPTTILHTAGTYAGSVGPDDDLGPVYAGDVDEPTTILASASAQMHNDEPTTILHIAGTDATGIGPDVDLDPPYAGDVDEPTTILTSVHVQDDEPTSIPHTAGNEATGIGPDVDLDPAYAGDVDEPTTILTSAHVQDAEPTTILQSAAPDQRLSDQDGSAERNVIEAEQAAALAIEVEVPATLLPRIHEHDEEPTTILQAGPDQPPLSGPEPGHDAADEGASTVTGAGVQGEVAPIHQAPEDQAQEDQAPEDQAPEEGHEPADQTEILPSPGVAGLADLPEQAGGQVSSRAWFDRRMRDFNHALLHTQNGEKRAVAERQALAAAARDMIQRVGLRDQEQKDGAWADTVLHADQLLVNTYFVRALIARGGVGEIYRARHRDLKTEHAIKILLPRYALDPTVLNLLLEEARLLQRVRHEAVVGCQGLLRDSDGRPMLVMDYLRGHTLSARLREGAMPTAELVQLAGRLAAGLGALHAQRLVHLDISPDNIMLVDDSCAAATIIDFGLARSLDAPENTHRNIDFAGKYSWCSPEQLSNRVANVDARSDLYSLGLVLLAAARGFRLDMGHDLATARDARQSVPSLAGIEEPIATLLRHLLAPSASARLKSAAEVPDWLKGKKPGMMRRLFAR